MTTNEFIEQIAALIKKYAPQYGICVYSPIIAQAILESARGTSNKVKILKQDKNGKYYVEWRHNYFGLKWRNKRCEISNEYFEEWTAEQNPDGTYKNIVSKFCKFNSMEEGVIGYFQWTNIPNYANLKGVTDPRTYLENIKVDKYATSHNYVDNLMRVIEDYNLTRFDNKEAEVTKMAKVFLSAGHGGSDPGAVANGLVEKIINLNALLSCKEVLEKHGVEVIASRLTDEDDPVAQEVIEANASGADVAVSFHANAGGGDGFEAFYWSSSKKGKQLAGLCEKYVKELGQNSRGIKTGNKLKFIKSTSMTSVLVESFFLDNTTDKTIGDTVAEQNAFGVAYAKAILEYLGIEYKTDKPNNNKPTDSDGKLYRVQVGAYKVKANADAMIDRLARAGFEGFIVEV